MVALNVQARTIAQLKECLRPGGPEALLRRLYQEYVLQRASMKGPGKGALSRWGGRGRGRGRESSGRGSGRSAPLHLVHACMTYLRHPFGRATGSISEACQPSTRHTFWHVCSHLL